MGVRTPQRLVEDLDGRTDESPAALADLLVGAARADLVVVGHIDIEHQLAALGLQSASGECLAVSGLRVSNVLQNEHVPLRCTAAQSRNATE